jgi:uncharacterized protein YjbI with pentapeptide repeats
MTISVLSFLAFLFVSSSSLVCGDESCRECRESGGFCICDVSLPLPSNFNKSDEGKEYKTKLQSVQAPLYERTNGFIWSNGERKKIGDSSRDIKSENFDFSVFRGYFNPDPDEYVGRLDFYSCSFYGATFGKSIFCDWFFHGCDFRYANFDGAEFHNGTIDGNCLFRGAKINGSRLNLSQEQFLSTDPFMKEVSTHYGNSVIRDRVLIKNFVLDIKNLYAKDFEGLSNKLHDVDFNKFYNGDKVKKVSALPCIIRDCVFERSFINCNFAGGELERTTFKGRYSNPPDKEHLYSLKITEYVFLKVEGCDFSSAKLKDVDFTTMSLKDSLFDDTEIYGVNFAGNTIFFDPQKFDSEGNELTGSAVRKIIENSGNNQWEKEKISWMMKNGLQKEQLMQTASFKKNKLINVKFCMNMSKLNLSGFNLTGCKFSGDLTDVDFADAVITDCVFGWETNLTAEQIKSTWNYKTNNMTGIKLPAEIQKALDAEKQQAKKNVAM